MSAAPKHAQAADHSKCHVVVGITLDGKRLPWLLGKLSLTEVAST